MPIRDLAVQNIDIRKPMNTFSQVVSVSLCSLETFEIPPRRQRYFLLPAFFCQYLFSFFIIINFHFQFGGIIFIARIIIFTIFPPRKPFFSLFLDYRKKRLNQLVKICVFEFLPSLGTHNKEHKTKICDFLKNN